MPEFLDTTIFESESEREEREAAMSADWDMFLSDNWSDPMEWEDQ